jgi:hypothetical protein
MTLLATSVHFMVRRSFGLRLNLTEATDVCAVSVASNEGQGNFLRRWWTIECRSWVVLQSRWSVRNDCSSLRFSDPMWSLPKRWTYAFRKLIAMKVSLVEHWFCKRNISGNG